ncbi:hypothetical protein ABZ719_27925 [Streptomyces sp. NPDC006743]|uniref:hypothetical protein n=1 Tax=Streptomyces sp. NPDC006743 TaxID=3154480 RepID=UPI003456A0EF
MIPSGPSDHGTAGAGSAPGPAGPQGPGVVELVADTGDPVAASGTGVWGSSAEHNPPGAQLTFSSPADGPEWLSVPPREQ